MDGDDWDPMLEPDELGELDSEVVRAAHRDCAQNKKVDPLALFFLFFPSDDCSALA